MKGHDNRKKLVATAQRRERIYKRTAEPSVTICDMYNRPQMCHRHIWGGKIPVCIQFRGTFLREKSSPNPSKDRFV